MSLLSRLFCGFIVINPFIIILAKSEKIELSQFQVDSLVDNSFFLFKNLPDSSDDSTRTQAIQKVKDISFKLRNIANNKSNSRYVLTKIKELEYQIFLEEHGLTLNKDLWKQKHINSLINDFNKIISDQRPDFTRLYDLKAQIGKYDSSMILQISKLFTAKAEPFHALLTNLIEQQLKNNQFDSAYNNLEYCKAQAEFLNFSTVDFARIDAQFLFHTTPSFLVSRLNSSLDLITKYFDNKHFSHAYHAKSLVNYCCNMLKNRLAESEWNRYHEKYQCIIRKIDNKEDSLIVVIRKYLKNDRLLEASSFIDTLIQNGFNNNKISLVNNEMMSAIITQHQCNSMINIYSFDPDISDANPMFMELILAAKSQKLAEREETSKKKMEYAFLTNSSEVKLNRFSIYYKLERKRMTERKSVEFENVYNKIVEIYSCIEKDSIMQAKNYFDTYNKLLSDNLSPDDLAKLNSSFIIKSPSADTIIP